VGLTSFLGTNLIGITGQFVRPDEAPRELDEPLRSIAIRAIAMRDEAWGRRRGCSELPLARQVFDRKSWADRYNDTVDSFHLATKDVLSERGVAQVTQVEIDRTLSALAFKSIVSHPRRYGFFVARELEFALRRIVTGQIIVLPMSVVATLLVLFLTFPSGPISGISRIAQIDTQVAAEALRVLFPVALLFAISKAVLVCSLEPAMDRYIDASAVFIPGCLLAAMIVVLGTLARTVHKEVHRAGTWAAKG